MDLSTILAKAAPWLAAAAAGPAGLAGMAIKTAATALGATADTAEAVGQAALNASPDAIARLKRADQQFQSRMVELGFKNVEALEGIAAGDRKDARAMHVANKSFMPALMTGVVCGMFGGALGMLFFHDVPVANKDIIVYMIGQLSGAFGASTAFWWGTTRQSEDKTRLLAQAPPVK